jgi:hypothetical protein
LLLRTLSVDERTFFSLKHLEWRLPSVVLWRCIDALGLRARLERIDYWPDTELGRLASRIHFHQLGSVEEHGIFFEERMYHHYFTFRRFPFPAVLRRVTDIEGLSARERRKLVETFRKVVAKAMHHRGGGRIWLTKENESVELYRLLRHAFEQPRFLVIAREPAGFVRSYVTMSNTCTTAKHGVDPNVVPGWHEANMAFRRNQCALQAALCRELEAEGAVAYVGFTEFTADLCGTVERIYAELGIPLGDAYRARLRQMQRDQDERDPGYANPHCDTTGFEAFADFVRRVQRARPALRTG